MKIYENPTIHSSICSKLYLYQTQATGGPVTIPLIPNCTGGNCDSVFEGWFCTNNNTDWRVGFEVSGISCADITPGETLAALGCQADISGSTLSGCVITGCLDENCAAGTAAIQFECTDQSPACNQGSGAVTVSCDGGSADCSLI